MHNIDPSSDNVLEHVERLKLLAHPVRYSICKLLAREEMNVARLQDELSLIQSTVSQHISKLRESNIVTGKRDGTKIYYSLTDDLTRTILDALS